MKAIQFHEFGGPEVLRLEDVPDPQPGPGEAVLRMHSAGVNPTDITTRSGRAPAPPGGFVFPSLLGREGAGVVEAVGDGVANVAVGDEVALRNAAYSYAELVKSPSRESLQTAGRPGHARGLDGGHHLLHGLGRTGQQVPGAGGSDGAGPGSGGRRGHRERADSPSSLERPSSARQAPRKSWPMQQPRAWITASTTPTAATPTGSGS